MTTTILILQDDHKFDIRSYVNYVAAAVDRQDLARVLVVDHSGSMNNPCANAEGLDLDTLVMCVGNIPVGEALAGGLIVGADLGGAMLPLRTGQRIERVAIPQGLDVDAKPWEELRHVCSAVHDLQCVGGVH